VEFLSTKIGSVVI